MYEFSFFISGDLTGDLTGDFRAEFVSLYLTSYFFLREVKVFFHTQSDIVFEQSMVFFTV